MKETKVFVILACMTCFFYNSCEKSGYTNEIGLNDNQRISNRTVEDCEDCPNITDCCCAVELQDDDDVITLHLCGTSDGASACTGLDNCGATFTGGGQQFTLQLGDSRRLFCVGQGNSFWIRNLHPSKPADLYITCQAGLTSPQIDTISIPSSLYWYYDTDNSCELTYCP
jgi:hypothetical protein